MKYLPFFCILLLLCGCAASPSVTPDPLPGAVAEAPAETVMATEALPSGSVDTIGALIEYMSIEERVGQLFLARCDAETAVSHIAQYHLGGFVFFSQDFEKDTPDSFRTKIAAYKAAADVPMLFAVDEEGGTVTRISKYSAFSERKIPSPREAFASGGMDRVLETEEAKCQLLKSLGLNVNLGPVCDITTDPDVFMYQRSLGQSAETTASFVTGAVTLMQAYEIGSTLKHFPGYGDNVDTHTDIAVDRRTLEELEAQDLLPFEAGIEADCGAILVSHTIVDALDAELPASLSPAVHRYLREEMGFSGVILTDDLMMEAIAMQYGAGEAAVLAVLAGNDLLCSTDYVLQYEAVLAAVLDGRISMDTLNTAVRNVLEWKTVLGLLG